MYSLYIITCKCLQSSRKKKMKWRKNRRWKWPIRFTLAKQNWNFQTILHKLAWIYRCSFSLYRLTICSSYTSLTNTIRYLYHYADGDLILCQWRSSQSQSFPEEACSTTHSPSHSIVNLEKAKTWVIRRGHN